MIHYNIPFNPNRNTDYGNDQLALIVDNGWNADDGSYFPHMTLVNFTQKNVIGFHYDDLKIIVEHMANKENVSAIRLIRDKAKIGLYEAKQIYDCLRDSFLDIQTVTGRVQVEEFHFK